MNEGWKKQELTQQPFPIPYGNKICLHCELTVVEYVNGTRDHLPEGRAVYVHHKCSNTLLRKKESPNL